MNNQTITCHVLVIGSGPGGIAAAVTAAESGQAVVLIDNNPVAGGQIWRQRTTQTRQAQQWFTRLDRANVKFIGGAQVFGVSRDKQLLAETSEGLLNVSYNKLILATGARERFIPFPGWTLPGVIGAGGLQALVKSNMAVDGKRIVLAGTGPLLVAVAAYLKQKGANILLVAEQASAKSLARFGMHLFGKPKKLWQSLVLGKQLWGLNYTPQTIPIAAHGDTHLTSVTIKSGNHVTTLDCDLLGVSFSLVPNTELSQLLKCACDQFGVKVDQWQQTSVSDIYAVGELTGISGVESALVEGQIAGFAATGKTRQAQALFRQRDKERIFAEVLERTFSLQPMLKTIQTPDTIVCRCEDITHDQLTGHASWRAAKLQTRCGMGPCQGRVCGPALASLYGWEPASVRPPLYPVRAELLSAKLHQNTENNF